MSRENKPRYRADRDTWVSKIDGHLVILARGKRNHAEAVKRLRQLLAARATGQPGSITVAELFDRLLDWTHENRAPLTYEFYLRHLRSFAEFVGRETPIDAIRPYHVDQWLARHKWASVTRRGAVSVVKRAFRWGWRKGYLPADPLDSLERPASARRESILSPDQERMVLKAASGPLSDYLAVMHETGCRPSEVARMTARDVQGDTVVMGSKTTRATGRQRVIYLTPIAVQIVNRLCRDHPTGPIFRNQLGNPWTGNALGLAMRRLRKRLGMGKECTAESFRHGWVTDAKLKLPNSVVAELVGHTSTTMIDRHYGHVNERRDDLARAAAKVRGDGTDTAASSPGPGRALSGS